MAFDVQANQDASIIFNAAKVFPIVIVNLTCRIIDIGYPTLTSAPLCGVTIEDKQVPVFWRALVLSITHNYISNGVY